MSREEPLHQIPMAMAMAIAIAMAMAKARAMTRAMAMAAAAAAAAVIKAGHACRGPPSTKIHFLWKNAVVSVFWSFLDLLDLKNGSGSKFDAGKRYREIWKPKINLFRDKTMNL